MYLEKKNNLITRAEEVLNTAKTEKRELTDAEAQELAEIAKKDAPTLFQINGPVGYEAWKEYCADLKDTQLYKDLLNQDMAIKSGDGVYGIPYVEEGYGIIYNQAIMDKYFALDGSKAKSVEEINNSKISG